jgi:hypothetical protein
MELTSIANELSTLPIESFSSVATSSSASQSQVPVSDLSAKVDGQTEGVQVSEVGGTYFAGVPGPPDVTTSGSSLAGAEDKLAYIVNLFA